MLAILILLEHMPHGYRNATHVDGASVRRLNSQYGHRAGLVRARILVHEHDLHHEHCSDGMVCTHQGFCWIQKHFVLNS